MTAHGSAEKKQFECLDRVSSILNQYRAYFDIDAVKDREPDCFGESVNIEEKLKESLDKIHETYKVTRDKIGSLLTSVIVSAEFPRLLDMYYKNDKGIVDAERVTQETEIRKDLFYKIGWGLAWYHMYSLTTSTPSTFDVMEVSGVITDTGITFIKEVVNFIQESCTGMDQISRTKIFVTPKVKSFLQKEKTDVSYRDMKNFLDDGNARDIIARQIVSTCQKAV